MVGAQNIHSPVADSLPQGAAVMSLPDRRVLLRLGAKLQIAVRRGECEMIGQNFNGGDIPVLRQNRHLLRRADVQDMHPPPRLPRQPQQPRRRQNTGLHRAPDRVHRRIGAVTENIFLVLDHHRLILGMDGHNPPPVPQNGLDLFVRSGQKVARGRPHEDFNPAHPGKFSHSGRFCEFAAVPPK